MVCKCTTFLLFIWVSHISSPFHLVCTFTSSYLWKEKKKILQKSWIDFHPFSCCVLQTKPQSVSYWAAAQPIHLLKYGEIETGSHWMYVLSPSDSGKEGRGEKEWKRQGYSVSPSRPLQQTLTLHRHGLLHSFICTFTLFHDSSFMHGPVATFAIPLCFKTHAVINLRNKNLKAPLFFCYNDILL